MTSWQGWVVTALFVVLLVASIGIWHGSPAIPFVVLLLAYGAVVLLTGDPPGSRRSRGNY